MTPLASLIATGTKLWLDSIDPTLVVSNRQAGATGATSNPIIVADLIKTGRFDSQLASLMREGLNDHDVAWKVTDQLVQQAQQVFLPVWEQTRGNDGYVSFELDPLLEDASCPLSIAERAAQYVALGKQWAAGHKNRMIKVPATPAGLAALTVHVEGELKVALHGRVIRGHQPRTQRIEGLGCLALRPLPP